MILEAPVLKKISDNGHSDESRYKNEVIKDLWTCLVSREVSILARREVLTGKAKFGILGDGKEVPQVAMARAFKKGDHRSGYYRDQTLMFALGLCSIEDFFAQLFADAEHDPFSGGRQMNSHFSTPYLDANGSWLDQMDLYNISADVSCTGGQMGRALGLATASKLYRESKVIDAVNIFSNHGNEVCFCTIGDASTSEGVFWETMNAAVVMNVPLAVSVWDDGYGISVPKELQTAKASISTAMQGFLPENSGPGLNIYKVKGYDYPALCAIYEKMIIEMRSTHRPALLHVEDLTQPQGHSTSGSHERYKTKERLLWEKEYDCIEIMADWMLKNEIITTDKLVKLRKRAKEIVREGRNKAWKRYCQPTEALTARLKQIYREIESTGEYNDRIAGLEKELVEFINPLYSESVQNGRRLFIELWRIHSPIKQKLDDILQDAYERVVNRYNTHLYSQTDGSALKVPVIPPQYTEDSKYINGFKVLNHFFDKVFEKRKDVVAFGEDVGLIGDVNQGFAGLQKKYGAERIFDCGIREWTIVGQAIGLALRGFRPIAEIQYLDYMIFGLAPLTDDLATLRYRSNGTQKAPAIIRTRGHRLEGIWHAGSPLGMLINCLRGIYVITPRNMVQAAGFYNTILHSDEPAIIIECLNGYRLKERLPDNIGEYTIPLGMPEILTEGGDLTLVTYGSCVNIALRAVEMCKDIGISVELIDVQTLIPFDLEHIIVQSLKKTNRVLFLDEDVPGGGTAYMMQKVLEDQNGYMYLDSPPQTLTASNHRPPYGSDGDYFSKPNEEDIVKHIGNIMIEADPARFQ